MQNCNISVSPGGDLYFNLTDQDTGEAEQVLRLARDGDVYNLHSRTSGVSKCALRAVLMDIICELEE